jgi:hypothetical protein
VRAAAVLDDADGCASTGAEHSIAKQPLASLMSIRDYHAGLCWDEP